MTDAGWQVWALLAAVFAALTTILAKQGVEAIDSDLATLLRTIVVVAVLLLLVTAKNGWADVTEITPTTAIYLTLSGLATGASWLCFFRALKLGDAARVAPIDKLSVVFVAMIGVFVLGERLSLSHWLGIALIFFGVVLLARS